MKRGISLGIALLLCAAALAARLLWPAGAEQLRTVFFADDAVSRAIAVFAPNG